MIKFGTSGFRAQIADGFTKENIQKIAQALAKVIISEKSTKPVLIGYDRRFFSDVAAEWFAEVLAGHKIASKIYTKPVPSPAVMYGVKTDELDYGVIITASHNPYHDNGLKIAIKGGADADNVIATKIQNLSNKQSKIKTLSIREARAKKLVEDYDNMNEYLKNIGKICSKQIKTNKLKVIFNAMHGACAEYANQFAKMLKISKFTLVNDSVDPYFERRLPAPEEECLEEFRNQVVKGKYLIGVAVDGDGDRLGVIDEQGTYHNNNILMAIAYYYLIKYRGFKGDIVKNLSTSNVIDKLAETFGYKCHEVPVGFKYTSATMRETDALLGGESSGGMTMRNYTPCKDSFFSIALILDAMVNINKPLSKIVEEVKEFCGYTSTFTGSAVKVVNRKKMEKALLKLSPKFSYKPKEISHMDGTKYFFDDGSWVLLRFSGTESVLRYYMEFSTEIECERNLKAILNFIDKNGQIIK